MPDLIRSHIATHLEELALLSLPVIEDAGSGGADSHASADSLTTRTEHFQDLPPVRPCNSFENMFEDLLGRVLGFHNSVSWEYLSCS
jgi:hypothetical protein